MCMQIQNQMNMIGHHNEFIDSCIWKMVFNF